MTETPSFPVEPSEAQDTPHQGCPETVMDLILSQLSTALDVPGATAQTGIATGPHSALEADAEPDHKLSPADKLQNALATWAGLADDGDEIEAMIAAQLVASQDLSMRTIGRAINRVRGPGHAGTSISDACKVATLSLRQIETLSRYRTWKHQFHLTQTEQINE